jgi:predicted MPP superfamily phosphohydrolase
MAVDNQMNGLGIMTPVRKYALPLCFALAVTALVAFADLVVAPLHAAGRAQGVLGRFLGFVHVLNMPGFTASGLVGLRPRGTWTWMGFASALPVTLTFWFVAALILTRLRQRPSETANDQPAERPTGISRRALILGGTRALTASGIGLGAYGFFGESRWFEITRRQVRINGLPSELDGLRLVHLTDIHHCSWTSTAWLRQIVEATNGLGADVVALTGDYVYRGLDYVRPAAVELARLRPRIGVVGVMGNHDWWENGELTKWAFEKEGVPLIDNARRFVTRDRRLVPWSKDGLCLAGVGDLWEDKCLYDDALGGVAGGVPRVLLSHNPDVAEEPGFLASGHRVDLMLSGHTHGGQVRVPGLGAPVTNSAYGQKYAQGLVDGPVCPVFISRGLGTTVVPVRIGVRPEIAVIELLAGRSESEKPLRVSRA